MKLSTVAFAALGAGGAYLLYKQMYPTKAAAGTLPAGKPAAAPAQPAVPVAPFIFILLPFPAPGCWMQAVATRLWVVHCPARAAVAESPSILPAIPPAAVIAWNPDKATGVLVRPAPCIPK